jgi:tetratricopeptide (TPR) repeat protein
MYDVFLSYRHADAAEVGPFVEALRAAGLQVWFDASAIETFEGIQGSIEQGLGQSRALVAWYSQSYPQSLACQWELTWAFVHGQRDGDPRRRVMVVNPEAGDAHIQPVELRDALYRKAPRDPAELASLARAVVSALERVPSALSEIAAEGAPTWYGAAAGNGSSRFFGRLAELWAIHSGLWASDVPVITNVQSRPLVRLTGIGGAGKSLVAETYAVRFGAAYAGGVFWLRAFGHDVEAVMTPTDRKAQLEAQVLDFALARGLPTAGLGPRQVREALGALLSAGPPYLWVVDDLPSDLSWADAQAWLAPSANGRSLVTTRGAAFDWAGTEVRLGDLDEGAALRLLTHARAPQDDAERADARRLVDELGRHPLALELAAAAVRVRGFAGFLESLGAPSRDVMDFAAALVQTRGGALPHRERANLNLSRTLLLSVDALSEGGRDFLRLAAELAPVGIARELVAHTLAGADGLAPADAYDAADLAMADAAVESLAREAEPGALVVHTLVVRAVRFRDADRARSGALREAALPALEAVLGDDIFDVRLHAPLRDPITHARTVLTRALADPAGAALAEIRLLDALQTYDAYHGNYASALQGAEALMLYSQSQNGPAHPHTLLFATRVGRLQRLSGDARAALATAEATLETSLRANGEDDPQTLTARNDQALALVALGELARARALQERVLRDRARVLGARHVDTAEAMNNLATTLAIQGDFAAARPLQEEVVRLRTALLGPDHLDTRDAWSNLAVTLRALGDAASALGIEQEAIDAYRGAADAHPQGLTGLNNLAATLHASGRSEEARQLFERVLAERRRQLGDAHPDTLATANSLGAVLLEQGRPEAAEPLLEESLARGRATLGPQHPVTLHAAYHLVLALVRQGDPTGRVPDVMADDLAELMRRDPESLPFELRRIREALLPLYTRDR